MSRRFQFSLRALLVTIFVAAIAAAGARYHQISRAEAELADCRKVERRLQEIAEGGHYCGSDEPFRVAAARTAQAERMLKMLRGH